MNKNVTTVLDGLNVKSRDDGSVHTIRFSNGGGTAAEVCCGKSADRLNFKGEVDANLLTQLEVNLEGRSQSWRGGGIRITDANVQACSHLLHIVADSPKPAKDADASTADTAAIPTDADLNGATAEQQPETANGSEPVVVPEPASTETADEQPELVTAAATAASSRAHRRSSRR